MDADVILKEIQFNHDRQRATHDAFNIRFNEANAVELPEWRRGITFTAQQSPAAYAIKETRGNTLTIKARFTGTANSTVLVRAVQARPDARQTRGCNPIVWLWPASSSKQRVNVLGEVREREITFDATGETDLEDFELQNVLIWTAGVSVSTTEWRWQFRATRTDRQTDFAITKHRIYTVLQIPNCPWQQNPSEAEITQLPWAEALEYACNWAAGAHDVDEAAELITRAINDLGLSRVCYSGSPLYSCPNFNCTEFLNLLGGDVGMGPKLNCSDCATAVSSFSNLVGCDLRQLQLGPDEILTNFIKKIGDTREDITEFFEHEVAWDGPVTEQGKIFDACLHLDGDPNPEKRPFVALLPTSIPFGSPSEKQYRFRLSSDVILRPETLACRKIGYSVAGICKRLGPSQVEFLKVRYDFAAWGNLPPPQPSLFAGHHSSRVKLSEIRFEFHDLILRPPIEQPKFAEPVEAFQSLWLARNNRNVVVRIDVFALKTWQAAREFMLRELGEFHQLQVQRLIEPTIGDVSFIEAQEQSILFGRSELVILVRSVGGESISVRQTANKINQLLSLFGETKGFDQTKH